MPWALGEGSPPQSGVRGETGCALMGREGDLLPPQIVTVGVLTDFVHDPTASLPPVF